MIRQRIFNLLAAAALLVLGGVPPAALAPSWAPQAVPLHNSGYLSHS